MIAFIIESDNKRAADAVFLENANPSFSIKQLDDYRSEISLHLLNGSLYKIEEDSIFIGVCVIDTTIKSILFKNIRQSKRNHEKVIDEKINNFFSGVNLNFVEAKSFYIK